MVKYVLRRLARSPMFTTVALLMLSMGIGANIAMFSVIDGVLLKPLPYPEPQQLAGVWHLARGANVPEWKICPSMYFLYREQNRSFADIGAYLATSVSVNRVGEPEQVQSLWVTDGVLPILGAQAVIGRLFTRHDDTDGSPFTAMLTYGYWQSRFGGQPSVIGRHIVVDGGDCEIIGVLSRTFRFMSPQPALVLPLQFNQDKVYLWSFSYRGIARLRPGVTVAEANADIARLIPIWMTTFPAPPEFGANLFESMRLVPNVRPFAQDVVGNISSVLWMLMASIGIVLLIACANIASLLLVRMEGRRQELAIRSALGAGCWRTARELLYESMTLALAGGALGTVVAFGTLRILVANSPEGLPRLDEISIYPHGLFFTLAISLIAGTLLGVLPVLKSAGVSPADLRESNRNVSASRERYRARNFLVIVQVSLATVLLIASGLMIRTFRALQRVEPGFTQPEEVLTLHVSIPSVWVKQPERASHMHNDILSKITAVPGVEAVGMSNSITMDGNTGDDRVLVEDHPLTAENVVPDRRFKFISPGFFQAVGRRFIAGRDLTWNDIFGFRLVVIVSESFAREYWRDPSVAIGRRIREGMKDDWREIIGVVGDEYDDGVQKKPPAVVYWPFMMKNFWDNDIFAMRNMAFAVRSRRNGSSALLKDIQRAVWSVSPNSPLAQVRTLEEIYGQSMARTTYTLVLLATAAGMALSLGLIGIYGVVAYSVSERRREIGIRMALGACPRQVSSMFIRQGLMLASIGIACGLVASAILTRWIDSMLVGVTPIDFLTYLAVSLGLGVSAVLASYIPARRAAVVLDPFQMLQSE